MITFKNLKSDIIMSKILREQFKRHIDLTDQEFDYILSHFSHKKFKKHQFLLQEDQFVMDDYFLLKGCVKSYYTDAAGKVHLLLFVVQDWWITDYEAYYY